MALNKPHEECLAILCIVVISLVTCIYKLGVCCADYVEYCFSLAAAHAELDGVKLERDKLKTHTTSAQDQVVETILAAVLPCFIGTSLLHVHGGLARTCMH